MIAIKEICDNCQRNELCCLRKAWKKRRSVPIRKCIAYTKRGRRRTGIKRVTIHEKRNRRTGRFSKGGK